MSDHEPSYLFISKNLEKASNAAGMLAKDGTKFTFYTTLECTFSLVIYGYITINSYNWLKNKGNLHKYSLEEVR